MNPASAAHSRALQYLLFAAALMPFYLLPLWAGLFSAKYSFTGQQLGMLLSADMAFGTAASLLARLWIHRLPWRPPLITAILFAGIANFFCVYSSDFATLLSLRCLAGFAAGSMMAFPYASLASYENPDREFSLALALQVFLGAGALLLVSHFDADGNDDLGFVLCSICALLPLMFITSCPNRNPGLSVESETSNTPAPLSLFLVLALTAVCLFFTALTAIWVFMERLGSELGINNSLVASILALGLLFSFVGAISPSLAISYLQRHTLLKLAYVFLLVSIVGTGLSSLVVIFALSIAVYNFFYSFMIPLQTA